MDNITQKKLKSIFEQTIKQNITITASQSQERKNNIQISAIKTAFLCGKTHTQKVYHEKYTAPLIRPRYRKYSRNTKKNKASALPKMNVMDIAHRKHLEKIQRAKIQNSSEKKQRLKINFGFTRMESYGRFRNRKNPFRRLTRERIGTFAREKNPAVIRERSFSNVMVEKASKLGRWSDDFINGKTVKKVQYVPAGFHFSWDIRKMGYYVKPSFLVGYKQTGHILEKGLKKYSVTQYEKEVVQPKTIKGQIGKYSKDILKDSSNMATNFLKTGAKISSRIALEGTLSSCKANLRNEGLGGETVAQVLSMPVRFRVASRSARAIQKGTTFGVRTTWNTVKYTGIAVYNTATLAADGASMTARLYKKNKQLKNMLSREKYKQKLKEAARKAAQKAAQEAAIKIAAAARTVAVKVAELVVALVTKLLCMGLAGIILLILLVLLPVIIVLIFFVTVSGVLAPLEDGNSIMVTHQYCQELTEDWKEEIEKLKEKYEVFKDCTYGNKDKCTIHIQCQENLEREAEVMPSSLELYALMVVEYQYEVQNMGVSLGNEFDGKAPSETEMKGFVKNAFFYLNTIKEEDMLIEQEILECYKEETVEGENGPEINIHQHDYILTNITIELRTIEDLLVHLGWNNDKINEYNDFLNELLLESYNLESMDNSQWKQEIQYGSDYDYMEKDIFIEFWDKDVPVLNITRAEFVEMVKSYCTPTGKIKYKFGSKNPASGALDCSGYTSYMFDLCDVDIKEGTAGQWANSVGITAASAKPGDLVFKQTPSSNGINHVGIYLGNGQFAHCASKSGTIINSYKGFIYYRRPLVRFKDDVPEIKMVENKEGKINEKSSFYIDNGFGYAVFAQQSLGIRARN